MPHIRLGHPATARSIGAALDVVVAAMAVLPPLQTRQGKLRVNRSQERFMAEELDFSNPDHTAGSTMAAFALAQMCFSILVSELILKADAEKC